MNNTEFKFSVKNKMITTLLIEEIMNGEVSSSAFKKNSNPIDFIKKHYNIIIKNVAEGYLWQVVKKLYSYPEMREFLDENFFYHLDNAKSYEKKELLEVHLSNKSIEEQVLFLKPRINDILDYIDNASLYQFLKYKDYDIDIRNALNNKIKNDKKAFLEPFLIYIKNFNDSKRIDDATILVEKIVDEILKNENKDWVDIEYLTSGSYSDVLVIGNKVLKIGMERASYRIPYDKRILQPLIRVNFASMVNDNENFKGVIEVSERVNTDIYVSDERMYDLYKEIRNRGIICSDMKSANLGILLKDNKKYWNKDLADSKYALGYIDEANEEEVLKAGELVLIDTDYIYEEDNPNILWGNLLSSKFEKRYKTEKKLLEEALAERKKIR